MNEKKFDAVVLIKSCNPDKKDEFGTGFVIHKDENYTYILTCAHVFEDIAVDGQVRINSFAASLLASGRREDENIDLAVLRVKAFENTSPMRLANIGNQENRFKILGSYDYDEKGGIARRGLTGKLGENFELWTHDGRERIGAWDLVIEGKYPLEAGYSGSPVVDTESGRVVGVVSHERRQGREGYAISIDALRRVWAEADNQ